MYRNRISAPREWPRMGVDLISNTVAITNANPAYPPSQSGTPSISPAPWGKALADGILSIDLIRPVLHELTHHTCLQTPVGNSLGALAVSPTMIVGGISEDANRLIGPARDVIRLKAAKSFLNPILDPSLRSIGIFGPF